METTFQAGRQELWWFYLIGIENFLVPEGRDNKSLENRLAEAARSNSQAVSRLIDSCDFRRQAVLVPRLKARDILC